MVSAFDPQTFYTVEDVRKQEAGVFPNRKRTAAGSLGVPLDAAAGFVRRDAAA